MTAHTVFRHVVSAILFAAFVTSVPAGEKKRFGFDQARIVLHKSVSNPQMETITTDTVYIGSGGLVEVRYSHEIQDIRMLNQKRESRTVTITKDGWITSYDPDTKKGKRFKDPFSETLGNMSESQQQKFAKGMENAFEAKTTVLGKEDVAGKQCDVTETKTGLQGMESVTKTWTWKGFVAKLVSEAMGTRITEEASSIDETLGVTEALLRIPSGVEIQDLGAIDP